MKKSHDRNFYNRRKKASEIADFKTRDRFAEHYSKLNLSPIYTASEFKFTPLIFGYVIGKVENLKHAIIVKNTGFRKNCVFLTLKVANKMSLCYNKTILIVEERYGYA